MSLIFTAGEKVYVGFPVELRGDGYVYNGSFSSKTIGIATRTVEEGEKVFYTEHMTVSEPIQKRLLIGSGSWHWSGWVTLDSDPAYGADYVCSVPPLPDALKAQRFDEILCVHMIEHVAPWLALNLAHECYEVLNIGGVFALEQPNILYAASVLLGLTERPVEEFPGQYDMAAFYGDPTHRNELMLHRWGYHPRSLTDMLVEAGFERSKIHVGLPQYHGQRERDFRIEATR